MAVHNGVVLITRGLEADVAGFAATAPDGLLLATTDTQKLFICLGFTAYEIGATGITTVSTEATKATAGDGSVATPVVVDLTSVPSAAMASNSLVLGRLAANGEPKTFTVTELQTQLTAAGLGGSAWKSSVRIASTANGTLATGFENGDTIDGVALATGDRILLKNQTTGSENGIYTVNASGAPTRATDADTSAEVLGMVVRVREGTVGANTIWACTNTSLTLGSTSLTFARPPIDAATQLTGNLPVARFNSGSNAFSSRFWRGDGVWEVPAYGIIPGPHTLANTLTVTLTSGTTTNNQVVTDYNRINVTVSSTGKATLTGLTHGAGFSNGQVFLIENVSGGRLELVNGSGLSTYPFICSTGENIMLGVFEAAWIVASSVGPLMVYPCGAYTKIGTVKPSVTTEYGWLECDGSAVSRTTYADLFAVCSTTFGAGNGSTTFNVPDLRGRVPMGLGTGDHSGASNRTMGQKVGAETHTLSTGEIPAHTHSVAAGSAAGAGARIQDSLNTGANTYTSGSAGGGGAHNNMQPSLGLRYLIKW